MKKLLLITNIYPTGELGYGGTQVCHYYTKEWHKMGYPIRVIHFESLFPKPYYWVGNALKSMIQAKTGNVVNTHVSSSSKEYLIDDIPVFFVPMKKYIPHCRFSNKVMTQAFENACTYLKYHNYIPDIVVGHFVLPQLQFLSMFKKQFPTMRTAMVIHSDGSNIKSIYGKDYLDYMNTVDVWGFRSTAFQQRFELLYGKQRKEFLCYSGIPEKYINTLYRNFDKPITHFVFLGSLYKLKCVEDTIRALAISFGEDKFIFDIVGSGSEEKHLKKVVSKLSLNSKVFFHGHVQRDKAQSIINAADCFIMVSEHEAFGLVYVEAMAKGCITIATRGQGIDGVIIDGYNGFLCEAHNPKALACLIDKIRKLTPHQLKHISINAVNTAQELTCRKVAENYIKAISE